MDYRQLTDAEREVLQQVHYFCLERDYIFSPTGSREIGGYTEESDYDFVIGNNSEELGRYLRELGCTAGGNPYNTSRSFDKDKLNFILTTKKKAISWRRATSVCKVLGIRDKDSRVSIFRKIVENSHYDLKVEQVELESFTRPGQVTSATLRDPDGGTYYIETGASF